MEELLEKVVKFSLAGFLVIFGLLLVSLVLSAVL